MSERSLVATIAAILLATGTSASHAQDSSAAAASVSTLSGVYSKDQASRGEKTYEAKCTACHAPSVHTGEAFTRAWETRTAYDLFELIRTTMPNDDPGSLSREQYGEIVAYLFKLNDFPAGRRPLPTENEGLKQVKIESRTGPSC